MCRKQFNEIYSISSNNSKCINAIIAFNDTLAWYQETFLIKMIRKSPD